MSVDQLTQAIVTGINAGAEQFLEGTLADYGYAVDFRISDSSSRPGGLSFRASLGSDCRLTQ